MTQNPIVAKLRNKGHTIITLKDEKLGDSQWTIRPISTFELVENSDFFDNLPDNTEKIDPNKVDPKTYKIVKNSVLPMMKAFLPLCCIDPSITNDFDDARLKDPNSSTIHLKDVPIKLASELFNEILKISGLTAEAEEERKKLASQTSAKQ